VIVTTDVHQLDDGAWVSVNDSREVNVSDLWLLAEHDLCGCEVADFLAEGVTGWLTVGRVVDPADGGFRGVDHESIHLVDG